MSDFEYWWENEGQYNRAGGSEYEKTFAWEAWNHQQQKISELESKLKAINEYQKIIYDQMQEHNLNYELIFNKLEDIGDLSK